MLACNFHNLRNKLILLALIGLATHSAKAVEAPVFLGDNNTSVSAFQDARNFTSMGDHVYFRAIGAQGWALFKTDGTAGGVELVKDIATGYDINSSGFYSELVTLNENLYYIDSDGYSWSQLWKSDGTPAGTTKICDLIGNYQSYDRNRMAAGANFVFLASRTDNEPYHLFKTDGTDAGTTAVGNVQIPITVFEEVAGIVYFPGTQGIDGVELWRTDGTDAGTYQVKDINPGPQTASIGNLTTMNGALYFTASDGIDADALWISDGTEAGTVKLTGARVRGTSGIVNVGGTVYFAADETGTGQSYQLWKTDGTIAGTEIFKDYFYAGSAPGALTEVDGELMFQVFSSNGDNHGLWKSDGTDAGTTRVAAMTIEDAPMASAGGKAYFKTSENGEVLWQSDGTPEGTMSIQHRIPGINSFYPVNIKAVNDEVYLTTQVGTGRDQVYKILPSTDEIIALSDSASTPKPSFQVGESLVVGDKVYYNAWDGEHGRELWVSDGTPAGTHIVADITPGPASSNPAKLTDVGGTIFFAVENAQNFCDLWKSDGTAAGTVLVKELDMIFPWDMAQANGELYINGRFANGNELWRSDGTELGTTLVDTQVSSQQFASLGDVILYARESSFKVADPTTNTTTVIYVGGPFPQPPVNTLSYDLPIRLMNGFAYFGGISAVGLGLWKTDGTVAGTSIVKDLRALHSDELMLTSPINGKIFFFNPVDRKLWISDGTEAGTLPLSFVGVPYYAPSLVPVIAAGDKFMFPGGSDVYWEPWITDGTAAGTFELTNYGADSTTAPVMAWPLASSEDYAYFYGNDLVHGNELWRTDGTPEGTVMVKDFWTGKVGSMPGEALSVGSTVIFSADDGVNGRELWAIEDEGGEAEMIDIEPGLGSSSPTKPVVVGNKIVFQAYTSTNGADLWALPVAVTSDVSNWTLY